MNSEGKWYLWANEAASERAFWNGDGWTTDAKKAVFFGSIEDANSDAHHRANRSTKCEVVVDQATRNVFA